MLQVENLLSYYLPALLEISWAYCHTFVPAKQDLVPAVCRLFLMFSENRRFIVLGVMLFLLYTLSFLDRLYETPPSVYESQGARHKRQQMLDWVRWAAAVITVSIVFLVLGVRGNFLKIS